MTRPSAMVVLAADYLALRRGLGYAMRIEGAELLRFARHADRTGHRGPITVQLAVRWATLPKEASPLYWARRLDVVRRFAKHRALFDARTEIPPEGLLGRSYQRPTPHIYSEGELADLLRLAAKLGPIDGLRPRTYVTLLCLLVVTGLRISEALRLTRDEVDLDVGLLRIVETKFHKSRLVPVHPSTTAALAEYARFRDRYHRRTTSRAFFLTEFGTPLKYSKALMTFTALRRALGWDVHKGSRSPRFHDMRHSFAVKRLLHWYQEGADIDQKIAALSTYLGHVEITETYWYLTAVPDLMALVGVRFEHYARRHGGDFA